MSQAAVSAVAPMDAILTLLFAIGLFQGCWLSTMAARRGAPSSLIVRAMMSLTGIWVVFWPLYVSPWSRLVALMLFLLVILVAGWTKTPAMRALGRAWSAGFRRPWPMLTFVAALAIAAAWSFRFPEFGFGAALAVCLGLPLAHGLDRPGWLRLGFPANPDQTLPGHLGLIAATIVTCGWSLHAWRQIGWMESLTATALAGIAASALRAWIPQPFQPPFIATAIGGILWAL